MEIPETHPLQQLFVELVSRHYAEEIGIRDPQIVGYVAHLLAEFCDAEQLLKIRNAAIQNGASYFTFGVSVELNVEGRIEVIDGSHEADYASGDEIVETDVTRQPVVNPPGNQPDLRKVLQHERLAPQRGVSIDGGFVSVYAGSHVEV